MLEDPEQEGSVKYWKALKNKTAEKKLEMNARIRKKKCAGDYSNLDPSKMEHMLREDGKR